jgi:hypothetical protein
LSKTILVLPDQHSHPEFNNDRADWAGRFILDLKPDIVVNIGDASDMSSLSSYDKGKRSFYGKSYAKDVAAHLDFQERLWHPIRKAKRKLPYSIFFEGNHEHRIEKALDLSPELVGTLDIGDFELDYFYDEFVGYDGATPGIKEVEGISFAHYMTSGVKGLPIGGEHHANSLLAKGFRSCVVGHIHTTDYAVRTDANGKRIQAVVVGVYQDYDAPWAGAQVNKLWWPGLVILHNVENGTFDPQWVSLKWLRETYSDRKGAHGLG